MTRRLTGTVVSDKPDQTVVVAIERRVTHPVYRKAYNVTKKVYAHDPGNSQKVGDEVTVEEIPPKSALKRWQVVTDEAASKAPAKKPAAKPKPADSKKPEAKS